jgi:hypothetical protein
VLANSQNADEQRECKPNAAPKELALAGQVIQTHFGVVEAPFVLAELLLNGTDAFLHPSAPLLAAAEY